MKTHVLFVTCFPRGKERDKGTSKNTTGDKKTMIIKSLSFKMKVTTIFVSRGEIV